MNTDNLNKITFRFFLPDGRSLKLVANNPIVNRDYSEWEVNELKGERFIDIIGTEFFLNYPRDVQNN